MTGGPYGILLQLKRIDLPYRFHYICFKDDGKIITISLTMQ